jgi:hypothetical protein
VARVDDEAVEAKVLSVIVQPVLPSVHCPPPAGAMPHAALNMTAQRTDLGLEGLGPLHTDLQFLHRQFLHRRRQNGAPCDNHLGICEQLRFGHAEFADQSAGATV